MEGAVTNNVVAAPLSDLRGDKMKCFDRLPSPLKRALWEGVTDWDPREVRWHLNKSLKRGVPLDAAVATEVAQIRAADVREVNAFQHHWPSRFGRYPHIAAGATILRYNNQVKWMDNAIIR